jgi:hypothetical protein
MPGSGDSARPNRNRPFQFPSATTASAASLYGQRIELCAVHKQIADALILWEDRGRDRTNGGCQRQTEQQRDENESHKAAPCRITGVVGVTVSATNGSMILLQSLYVLNVFHLSILARRPGFA